MTKKFSKDAVTLAALFAVALVLAAVGLRQDALPADAEGEVILLAPRKLPDPVGYRRVDLLEVRETGASFAVPEDYRLAEDISPSTLNAQLTAVDEGGEGRRSIRLIRELTDGHYCHLGYCDVAAEGEVSAGDVRWDFLGARQYCDAGECGAEARCYRVSRGPHTYYVSFVGVGGTDVELEVLRSVRFGE